MALSIAVLLLFLHSGAADPQELDIKRPFQLVYVSVASPSECNRNAFQQKLEKKVELTLGSSAKSKSIASTVFVM
jgi:hypothetical protein